MLKVLKGGGQHQEDVGLLPEFKVVSRPNDWVRESKKAEKSQTRPSHEKRVRFWSKVIEKVAVFQGRTPTRDAWFSKYAGYRGCHWNLDFLQSEIRVNLTLGHGDREHNKFIFDHIKEHHKADVEAAFGAQLQWDRKDEANRSMIVYSRDVEGEGWNEDRWDEFVCWLDEHINKLKDVLEEPLKEAVERLTAET